MYVFLSARTSRVPILFPPVFENNRLPPRPLVGATGFANVRRRPKKCNPSLGLSVSRFRMHIPCLGVHIPNLETNPGPARRGFPTGRKRFSPQLHLQNKVTEPKRSVKDSERG